jgi:hypothetical protein
MSSSTITPSAYEYVKARRDTNAEFLTGFREDLENLSAYTPKTEQERLEVEHLLASNRRTVTDLEELVALADRVLAKMRSDLGMPESEATNKKEES